MKSKINSILGGFCEAQRISQALIRCPFCDKVHLCQEVGEEKFFCSRVGAGFDGDGNPLGKEVLCDKGK